MKVLIAEDDPISALALETLLQQQGYEVTVATDGMAAWRAIQQESYPLVVLDWMMPEMDGVEVCRKIRERQSGSYVCVIMLTAKQERKDRMQALNAGADVFLTKPLDCEEMVARLRIARRILEMER
jgi:DNA-binding response OmpR family regulator